MFTLVTNALLVVGVSCGVLYLVNRKGARRLFQAIRAQVGKGGRAALEADPVAYLQQKLDDAVEKLGRAKTGLVDAKALVRSKTREVQELQKKQGELNARLDHALTQNNDVAARDILSRKNSVEAQLDRAQNLLTEVTGHYESHKKEVTQVSEQIAAFRRQAQDLKQELKMSERERETREALNELKSSDDGMDFSETSEAVELIQRKIDQNRGALDVEADLAPETDSFNPVQESQQLLDAQLEALKAERLGKDKILSVTVQEKV